jgi:hypothetical protein
MADGYKTPIDTFIEKAALSKPPAPRIPAPPKAPVVKNTTAAVPKVTIVPITSTLDPRLATKPTPVSTDINAATSDDIIPASIQPMSSTTPKIPGKPKSAVSRKKTAKANNKPTAETMGNGIEQNDNNIPNEIDTETQVNKKKRQRPSKETPESPESKRKKISQPTSTPQQNTLHPSDENNLEKAKILLSLVKENQGVFELVPRLDLLYAAHVARSFPTAQPYVDGKVLVSVLDDLEKHGELCQIMLSAETSTGTKQYKSILILPEVDPVTNPKILAIREELNREVASYKPKPIATKLFGGQTLTLPITSIDAVRALYQSTFDSRSSMVEATTVLDKDDTPSVFGDHRIQSQLQSDALRDETPDIPPTPTTPGSVEPTEKPDRVDKKKRPATGTSVQRRHLI